MKELEEKIGYKFKNPNNLELALTHSSYSSKEGTNNERLEFLGDKILGFVIAEIVYDRCQNENEGYLSKFLSYLTSKEVLLEISTSLALCENIKKQHSLESALGADVIEAVIAAVYLDSMSLFRVKDFIIGAWSYHIEYYLSNDCYVEFNPKSCVQEWAQKKGMGIPKYIDIEKQGTEHQPIFHVEIEVEGFDRVLGVGHSKKQAQKDASINFLKQYKII